jgi:hypothetical protein
MNTQPTPETDELIRTQSKRVGITPSVMVEKLTFKCEDLEMQRNAALDALRKIENIAANHPDTPLLALDSIIVTARKALNQNDENTK